MFDLGIRAGFLLTMKDGKAEVLKDHFVGISGGTIREIRPWSADLAAKAREAIDASGRLVMPGLINGHTHLPMSLLRGIAEDQPLQKWLTETILPIESKLVKPDFVRIGTELALLESICAGTTTVCDMYYFSDVIAETIEKAGLRALVGEAILDFPSPDNPKLDGESYRILDRMRGRWDGKGRIIPCVAPHAPYTCSDETLRKAVAYAGTHDLPLVIHVAETRGEVDESLAKHKMTPVKRLLELGVMGARSIFAHSVHVNADDQKLMARSGTSAIYNPESNMKLGSGIAPVDELLHAGVTVGIGTDGAASNNDLNILTELGSGARLQKLLRSGDSPITAGDMLKMATIGGAKALGIADRVGSIEIGKRADCIVLDLDSPQMQPLYDIPRQLVYAATGTQVRSVVCDGKVLMKDRKVLCIDTDRLTREIEKTAASIRAIL